MLRERPISATLLWCILGLVVIGLVMVYSASYATISAKAAERAAQQQQQALVMGLEMAPPPPPDSAALFKKQVLAAIAGVLLLLLLACASYQRLRTLALPLLLLALAAQALVLKFGTVVNGSRRWFDLGLFSFQPSEFTKFALVLAGAALLSANRRWLRTPRGFAACAGVLVVFAGLIAWQDLGTAVALVVGSMGLFLAAGAKLRHLALFSLIGLACATGLVVKEPYRFERIYAWLYPSKASLEGAYQLTHCKIALGAGGLIGRGLCESREKFAYLPAADTDCIFAILGEETGLLGTLVVLGLFFAVGYLGTKAAQSAPDSFAALLAAGSVAMICGQATLNIAVVTGMVPTTGVPLPFISAGGSSLLFTLASAGLILNVSRGGELIRPASLEALRTAGRSQRRSSGQHRRHRAVGSER